jgi:hypothetical protein
MSAKKYKQANVNRMFNYMLNGEELAEAEAEDCERIKKAISTYKGLSISIAEASFFWQKRSSWFDASWLSLPNKDEQILECWDKFIDDWHKDEVIDEE